MAEGIGHIGDAPPFMGLDCSLELSPASLSLLNRRLYIRYDEVEVHRSPMPLIVAPLRSVYRGTATGRLGQEINCRGYSKHLRHASGKAPTKPQSESIAVELDCPLEIIDIDVGQ